MRILIIGAGTALLAACASTVEIPKETAMPAPVACIDPADVPARPQILTERELLAMPEYQRTVRLWLDHWHLVIYKEKLEAIAQRCSKVPVLKPAAGIGLRSPP